MRAKNQIVVTGTYWPIFCRIVHQFLSWKIVNRLCPKQNSEPWNLIMKWWKFNFHLITFLIFVQEFQAMWYNFYLNPQGRNQLINSFILQNLSHHFLRSILLPPSFLLIPSLLSFFLSLHPPSLWSVLFSLYSLSLDFTPLWTLHPRQKNLYTKNSSESRF